MAYTLLGKNFTPPDVQPKVTGRAKYAEDFRVEGMTFCRLLLSPVPHARVRSIDASEALAMDGVLGVLTADEVLSFPMDPILTNEPMFVGQPILAVAAVDETTAENAIEKIQVDLEMLPFTIDPLESLYPGGPDARSDGNSATLGEPIRTMRWTAQDFAAEPEGILPMGEAVRRLDIRRSRCRLRRSCATAGRDLRDCGEFPSLDGAAHEHGLLAERHLSSTWLDTEPDLHPARARAAVGHPCRKRSLRR